MFLGKVVILSFLYALVAVFAPFALYGRFRLDFMAGAIGLLIAGFFLGNMNVYFKAEDRTKKVEDTLPDAFQMIAANLRAGMTPFKALKSISKGKSGPLEEEIEYVTSKALGTESFGENLLRISERIRSDTLDKSMKLFTTSMRSGGRLATLLEELAVDISETQSLKNELKTSTKTYTAFILFTILIGTPLLLAISVNFVKMMANMQSMSIASTTDFGLGNLMGAVTITPGFLTQIAVGLLVMTSVLASMLMGTINEGKPKSGLRMAPVIMAGCIIVFFVSGMIVGKYILGLG
jgi:archaeal flagellar protein FlaJ